MWWPEKSSTSSTRISSLSYDMRLLSAVVLTLTWTLASSDVHCPEPRRIPDASYVFHGLRLTSGRFRENATLTYTCDAKHTMGRDSSGVVRCVDGRWKNIDKVRCCKINICTDPDLFCRLPVLDIATTEILDGNESFVLPDDWMAYGLGTTIRFNCKDGYELTNGSTTGPFKCVHGGTWSPSSFTECQVKECPPPPHIADTTFTRLDYDQEGKYYVGSKVRYECKPGYEMLALMNLLECFEDLRWKTHLGMVPMQMSFMLNLPRCFRNRWEEDRSKPTFNVDRGGSSGGGSGGSFITTVDGGGGGAGGETFITTVDTSFRSKKSQFTGWKTLIAMVVVAVVLCVCCSAICAQLRETDVQRSRRNARTVTGGVTTTTFSQGLHEDSTRTAQPPILTTGRYTYVPSAPPETYLLTPQVPATQPRHECHNYEGPPPNYEEAMRK